MLVDALHELPEVVSKALIIGPNNFFCPQCHNEARSTH